MVVDFNKNILNSLLYQDPVKVPSVISHFPKIENWLKDTNPTFNQLVALSHYFKVPFGYFFLNELPVKTYPIPHYRTQGNQPFHPSPELFDVLETLHERQEWAKDILLEWREEKLPYANSIKLDTPIVKTVESIRGILNLSQNWAAIMPNWTKSLGLLVKRTEAAGIFVVMNGVVNNNTHRKLDVNEFRGFVLHNDYAPFVFINNNDFISGKIFTLIHEIAHIFLGKSASFDLRQLQPANNEIEKYCNEVAAEFLVPEIQLNKWLSSNKLDYQQLARYFKVSQIVIARRLLDIKKIGLKDFFEFYNNNSSKEYKQTKAPGGDFYNTVPYRISKRFFNVIYTEVKRNKMLYRDAFKLTGLKPKSYDEYVKRYLV